MQQENSKHAAKDKSAVTENAEPMHIQEDSMVEEEGEEEEDRGESALLIPDKKRLQWENLTCMHFTYERQVPS